MVKKKVEKKRFDFKSKNFVIGIIVVILVAGVLYFGLKENVLLSPEGNCVETGQYCEDSVCNSCEDICNEYKMMSEEDYKNDYEEDYKNDYEEDYKNDYEEDYKDEEEMFYKDIVGSIDNFFSNLFNFALGIKMSVTGNQIGSIENFDTAVACCACSDIYSLTCYDYDTYSDCNQIRYPICESVGGVGKCRKCRSDNQCEKKSLETPACIPKTDNTETIWGACQPCFTDEHCEDYYPDRPVCFRIAPMNRVRYFCVECTKSPEKGCDTAAKPVCIGDYALDFHCGCDDNSQCEESEKCDMEKKECVPKFGECTLDIHCKETIVYPECEVDENEPENNRCVCTEVSCGMGMICVDGECEMSDNGNSI